MKQIYLSILLCIFFIPLSKAQLTINEFSCANRTLQDNFNEREDWIELHNSGAAPLNIGGYFLSDRVNDLTKYQIPNISVAANGYVRFWASGKNTVVGTNYHTNFKLTQCENEVLLLTNTVGEIIDSITIVPTQANHSRGRNPNGGATWGIFTNPTPNASNGNTFFTNYAPKPTFALQAGFYPSAQSVSINVPAGYQVRYTVDGSTPTAASTQYSAPINVAATTLIKAISLPANAQELTSFIETNTYFIRPPHTVPVVSLGSNQYAQFFNSFDMVIPSSVEYFDENGIQRFETVAEIDRHGNDSWAFQQKGVDIVVRDQLGYNNEVNFPIFESKPRPKYQRFMLKAGASDNYPFTWGNGGCHIRDAYIQSLAQNANLEVDLRTNKSCVVYINGQYWGVYEIREKVNDPDYTDYYYNQEEEDIDMLSYWGSLRVRFGSADDWFDLFNFITTNSMADPANYSQAVNRFNMKSLIDYIILNTFSVNSDWINWNSMWWRGRNGTGVKWKYALWDMDNIFDLGHNYSGWPTTTFNANPCDLDDNFGNSGAEMGHLNLFNRLMENPDFKSMYVNRYAELINTYLSCDYALAHLDSMIAVIQPEMPEHVARWGGSMAGWQNNLQYMRSQIIGRCEVIQEGIVDCYDVTGPYNLKFNVWPANSGTIKFNQLDLPTYPYQAEYFGNVQGNLTATPNGNYVFDYWEVFNHTLSPNINSMGVNFPITQADSIVAHFRLIPDYNIVVKVIPDGGGTVGINGLVQTSFPYSTTVPENSTLFFNALAANYYSFEKFESTHHTFNPSNLVPDAGITVTQSDTILVYFKPDQQDTIVLMIQPANSGYITFQNTTTFTFPHVETVIPQTTPTVLAKAYENYRFVTWKTVNNILLPSPDSASMYFVSSGNDTLLAIFEPIPEIPQTTYFPLSFTPNNDGLNDFFQVFHSETVTEGSIKIFDRWGEIIFQSNDINFKWDGTMNGRKIPDGVYFYQFNYLVKGKRYETISNRLTIIR